MYVGVLDVSHTLQTAHTALVKFREDPMLLNIELTNS